MTTLFKAVQSAEHQCFEVHIQEAALTVCDFAHPMWKCKWPCACRSIACACRSIASWQPPVPGTHVCCHKVRPRPDQGATKTNTQTFVQVFRSQAQESIATGPSSHASSQAHPPHQPHQSDTVADIFAYLPRITPTIQVKRQATRPKSSPLPQGPCLERTQARGPRSLQRCLS
jgi:hypothetical protein